MGATMPETLQNCEYILIEYAPSPLRDARIAIGLLLFESSGRLVRHGFTQDWRHLKCLDPQADLDLLANLPAHFEQIRAATVKERAPGSFRFNDFPRDAQTSINTSPLYQQLLQMREDYSGGLQISAPRGILTTDPEREFEQLFQEHIDRPRPHSEKAAATEGLRPGSRRWIHARLSDALHRHAIWDRLSKDVPVDQFTAPGDKFRIDFAYRPNGVTKYLHAISLERDWNQSKLLSYTFWRIREKSQAQMTAIVADANPNVAAVESCRQILASAQIALQPLSLLDPYLDGVAQELRHV